MFNDELSMSLEKLQEELDDCMEYYNNFIVLSSNSKKEKTRKRELKFVKHLRRSIKRYSDIFVNVNYLIETDEEK